MACPFAYFAARTPSINNQDESIAGPSRSKLTAQLKSGTWEAHREIEKSPGVRALMGSHHAELAVQFNRMDHLCFLIMLGCIYVTMENVLFNNDSALRDIMPLLVRSDVLLDDIQAHLDEILSSKGASASDLDQTADEEAHGYYESILSRVTAAQASLKKIEVLHTSSLLTADHIALLTKRQAMAVQSYLDQFASLQGSKSSASKVGHYDEGISFTPLGTTPSENSASLTSFISSPGLSTRQPGKTVNNQLILAHAYVRYMGDLSGGQHIVKRLSKLFPIYDSDAKKYDGFRFYSFTSTGKSNSALKEMIRIRLDVLDLKQSEVNAIVDEASEAFLLNGKLLDSLVDEVDSNIVATLMAKNRSTLLSLPSYTSVKFLSLHLYHSHTLALVAASLLCMGLACAMYVS